MLLASSAVRVERGLCRDGGRAVTLLQRRVKELIERWEARKKERLSGGRLAALLGKSRNLLSQIMNDGLIPSGEVLMKLGRVLEADENEQRELVLAAMKTKAQGRARDTFWLQQALDLSEKLHQRVMALTEFLKVTEQLEEFERWAGSRRQGKKKRGQSSEAAEEDA